MSISPSCCGSSPTGVARLPHLESPRRFIATSSTTRTFRARKTAADAGNNRRDRRESSWRMSFEEPVHAAAGPSEGPGYGRDGASRPSAGCQPMSSSRRESSLNSIASRSAVLSVGHRGRARVAAPQGPTSVPSLSHRRLVLRCQTPGRWRVAGAVYFAFLVRERRWTGTPAQGLESISLEAHVAPGVAPGRFLTLMTYSQKSENPAICGAFVK